MRVRDLPIGRKITLLIVATSLLALVGSVVALLVFSYRDQRRVLTNELSSLAEIVANNSTAALAFQDQDTARELLDSLRNREAIVAVDILTRDGHVFASYRRDESHYAAEPGPPAAVPDAHIERDMLVIARPVLLDGRPIGSVWIQAELAEIEAALMRYARVAALIALVASLAVIAVSSRLQRVISGPILDLVEIARGVSRNRNYETRAVKRSEDEVGSLVDAFNEMMIVIGDRDEALRSARDSAERARNRAEELLEETKRAHFELEKEVLERERVEGERRRLEDQVRHAQKLESVGVLAGGIAHDFNNLLMAILGNTELALMDASTPESVRRPVEQIESAARQAAGLTRQLLAYSGRGQVTPETLQITDLVREMTRLLEVSISKKITLHYDLEPDLPPLEADASQVQQVVMNLITNASDAIGDDVGNVTIHTGQRTVDRAFLDDAYFHEDARPGVYVFVRVTDDGCGMDPETLEKIFDPFFTTKFTGRGLGLAGTLGIVRAHGAIIRVESRPGEGTSFEVYFPVATGDSEDRGETSQPGAVWKQGGGGGRTVLLVDDEPGPRRVIAQMLGHMGFDVVTAQDGRDGLERFRKTPDAIHLVVLDMTMPHMSGEETLIALRELAPDVPVIVISGFEEAGTMARVVAHEPVTVLQKPFTRSDLERRVGQMLGGDR
jgi:signal transduction histidine kinase